VERARSAFWRSYLPSALLCASVGEWPPRGGWYCRLWAVNSACAIVAIGKTRAMPLLEDSRQPEKGKQSLLTLLFSRLMRMNNEES
jgi:hypothetical protein